MKATIQPSRLKGNIQAPASKSSMQRACAMALLRKGTSIIHNPGHSHDDKAALAILRALGATTTKKGDELIISSAGFPFTPHRSPLTVDCGESGLGIRMFTPLLALSDHEITIRGSGSLMERPMDFFDQVLPALGVRIKSREGKLPLQVQGPMKPMTIEVDGSLSSQFLTGLLLAYSASPYLFKKGVGSGNVPEPVSIKVKNLASKPYIDLTLDVMKKFGLRVPENKHYREFVFHPEPVESPGNNDSPRHYEVEGDWSGGAFLLVAGVIAGPIMVRGLDLLSPQADKAIVDALMAANGGVAIEAKGIKVHPSEMMAFDFDATDCPDLFPPLVALAAYCKGATTIKGVQRLTHKESNRALTLQEEFQKMGLRIELKEDIMTIHGGEGLNGAVVHSRHDHRIAMACAVAALKARGAVEIGDAEAVQKSYPDFFTDLEKLGAAVSLNPKFNWHE